MNPSLSDLSLGKNVSVSEWANLYGCEIDDETRVGPFVEIQKNVRIGKRCKISSHSFLCEGLSVGSEVFIGHGVIFTNDRYPKATTAEGALKGDSDWHCEATIVEDRASIGSGSTILPGLRIGRNAMIGAGSVVTSDVLAETTVAGNPAKALTPSY